MSAALRRITFQAWKTAPRISQLTATSPSPISASSTLHRRPFSAAQCRLKDDDKKPTPPGVDPEEAATPGEPVSASTQPPADAAPRRAFQPNTESDEINTLKSMSEGHDIETYASKSIGEGQPLGQEQQFDPSWERVSIEQFGEGKIIEDFSKADLKAFEKHFNEVFKDEDTREADLEKGKLGYWAEGEEELGPDEEYHGDDLTSLGHGELDKHREMREYARIAAWEMPLLSKFARPFEPPVATQPLRFRYTTYMGEAHPAAHKVVVEFCPSDLPSLSPAQSNKLIKLLGPRYNPSTEIAKISCESFPSQPQNKRYLLDLVNSLIAEAKNPKGDSFEDVPFDFRHHKPKPRYEYPREWLITPERQKYLDSKRTAMMLEEGQKREQGRLLDGAGIIAEKMGSMNAAKVAAGADMAAQGVKVAANAAGKPAARRKGGSMR